MNVKFESIYCILRLKRQWKYSKVFHNGLEYYWKVPSFNKVEYKIWIDYFVLWSWNGNEDIPNYSRISRILLNDTFSPQSWIQNINRYILYSEIKTVIKIFQINPEYYWKVPSLNKAEYSIWIDIYCILRAKRLSKFEIFQTIILKGTFSQQSYIKFESIYMVFWDLNGNQDIPEYYWKLTPLNKAEYKIWIDIYRISRILMKGAFS